MFITSLTVGHLGVKAQSTGAIVINSDGSVLGISLIQRVNGIYRLSGNIYDMPITVLCNNIVLYGEGFVLQGAGGCGIAGADWLKGIGGD